MGIEAGEHTLRVSKNGYNKWERTVKSSTGKIKIAAVLEPIPVDAAGTANAPAEVAATSTVRDPVPAANSSGGMAAESLIGIWFAGNPTARHDGVEISGVQSRGPADSIGIQRGDVILAIDGYFLYTIDELRAELLRHERGRDWQYDIDTTDSPTKLLSPLALETRLLADESCGFGGFENSRNCYSTD